MNIDYERNVVFILVILTLATVIFTGYGLFLVIFNKKNIELFDRYSLVKLKDYSNITRKHIISLQKVFIYFSGAVFVTVGMMCGVLLIKYMTYIIKK